MKEKGFTLLELIIVIAIIGILASLAVPQYAQYTKRAKFSEVASITHARKTAVSICYQETNGFSRCNGTGLPLDYYGIPGNIASPGTGYVTSVTTAAGVITATGNSEVDDKTFILTPSLTGSSASNNLQLNWTISGSCLTANICRD